MAAVFDPTQPVHASPDGPVLFDPNQPALDHAPSEASALEAAGRGAIKGASVGLDNIGAGALGAGADVLTGNAGLSDLMDKYRQHRDAWKAAYDAASTAHPTAALVGNVGGSILPALLTGGASAEATGAKTLGQMAMNGAATGAKMGAVAGFGDSDADLTKANGIGDYLSHIGQAAADTAKGAGLGAGVGAVAEPVLGTASKVVGGLKDYALDAGGNKAQLAWELGSQGKGIGGESGKARVQKNVNDMANELWQGIHDKVEKPAMLGRGNELARAEAGGVSYPRAPIAGKMIDSLTPTNEFMNDGANADLINRWSSWAGDNAQDVGPTELESMKEYAGNRSGLNKKSMVGAENAKAEGFNDSRGELKNIIDQSIPGVKPFNQDMSDAMALRTAAMGADATKLPMQENAPNQVLDFVQKYGNQLDPKIGKQREQFENILDRLLQKRDVTGASPEAAQDIAAIDASKQGFAKALPDRLDQTSRDFDLVKQVNEEHKGGGLGRQLVGNVRDLGLKGVNMAAKADRSLLGGTFDKIGSAIPNAGTALINRSPGEIAELARQLHASGNPHAQQVAKVLEQSAGRDRIGRNALYYSLEQNPTYRDILNARLPSPDDGQE